GLIHRNYTKQMHITRNSNVRMLLPPNWIPLTNAWIMRVGAEVGLGLPHTLTRPPAKPLCLERLKRGTRFAFMDLTDLRFLSKFQIRGEDKCSWRRLYARLHTN